MSNMLPFLLIFIIALAIGIFIGKLIFSARFQSEKISLEEKLIALNSQFDQFKEQIAAEKSAFQQHADNIVEPIFGENIPKSTDSICVSTLTVAEHTYI